MKNKIDKTMPSNCPSCGQTLKVTRLKCGICDTIVEGSFDLSILTSLSTEEQRFVVMFVKSSGNLKDLAKYYSISYPTVRNRLDGVIDKITSLDKTIKKG